MTHDARVELIFKVAFLLTILWDELLSNFQSGVEGRGCPFFDTFTLLLFEGIEGIPMCAMFFPLDFEGKIH